MADDKGKRGKQDRIRISTGEAYELQYWKRELGVSGQQVVGAVRAVRPMVEDVEAYLKRKKERVDGSRSDCSAPKRPRPSALSGCSESQFLEGATVAQT